MAVVVFECDVCKRQIEKPRRNEGLEIIGRCVITDSCKGLLHYRSVKQTSSLGHSATPLDGVTDWVQRRVLYTHTQDLAHSTWQVIHELNTHPSVQLYIYNDDESGYSLREESDFTVDYVSEREFHITFDTDTRGVAQCISRSSSIDGKTPLYNTVATSVFQNGAIQLTTSEELTIATLDTSDTIDININYQNPADLSLISVDGPTTFTNVRIIPASPWAPTERVLINGRIYKVRSTTIDSAALRRAGVTTGSPVYFTKSNGDTFDPKEVYILLTSAPYDRVDINRTKLVDMSISNESNAALKFTLRSNELFAVETAPVTVYPPIHTPVS